MRSSPVVEYGMAIGAKRNGNQMLEPVGESETVCCARNVRPLGVAGICGLTITLAHNTSPVVEESRMADPMHVDTMATTANNDTPNRASVRSFLFVGDG